MTPNLLRLALFTTLGPGWLASEAGSILLFKALDIVSVQLGMRPPTPSTDDIKQMMSEFMDELKGRMDAELLTDLNSALDLTNASSDNQIDLKIRDLERIAILPQGETDGRPNSELRCLAYLGMLAASEIRTEYVHVDKNRVLANMLSLAIGADVTTARKILGDELVVDSLRGMTGLDRLSLVDSLNVYPEGFWDVDISPNGKLIALLGRDGVRVYETATGRLLSRSTDVRGIDGQFHAQIQFTEDGHRIMVHVFTTFEVLDATSCAIICRLPGSAEFASSPDRFALITEDHKRLILLDGNSLGVIREQSSKDARVGNLGQMDYLMGVGISLNGKLVATSGQGGIKISELDSGREVQTFALGALLSYDKLRFSDDGKTLFCENRLVGYSSGFDLESGTALFINYWYEPMDVSGFFRSESYYEYRGRKSGVSADGYFFVRLVGNQQKWDTFVMKKSGGCGSVVGLPALPVVEFAPL